MEEEEIRVSKQTLVPNEAVTRKEGTCTQWFYVWSWWQEYPFPGGICIQLSEHRATDHLSL